MTDFSVFKSFCETSLRSHSLAARQYCTNHLTNHAAPWPGDYSFERDDMWPIVDNWPHGLLIDQTREQ